MFSVADNLRLRIFSPQSGKVTFAWHFFDKGYAVTLGCAIRSLHPKQILVLGTVPELTEAPTNPNVGVKVCITSVMPATSKTVQQRQCAQTCVHVFSLHTPANSMWSGITPASHTGLIHHMKPFLQLNREQQNVCSDVAPIGILLDGYLHILVSAAYAFHMSAFVVLPLWSYNRWHRYLAPSIKLYCFRWG